MSVRLNTHCLEELASLQPAFQHYRSDPELEALPSTTHDASQDHNVREHREHREIDDNYVAHNQLCVVRSVSENTGSAPSLWTHYNRD